MSPLKGRDDGALRTRLKTLAEEYPRYGYPTPHDLLKTEGLVIRQFMEFNVVDDFSPECVLQIVDFSIGGERLARELDQLAKSCLLAKKIVMDNGPELTGKAMFFWAKERGVKLHFIQPGKPTRNAFVESFNAKFCDYCLNPHWFATLADARSTIEDWRTHYNHLREDKKDAKDGNIVHLLGHRRNADRSVAGSCPEKHGHAV